ncbi:MAG: ribonuclease III [Pseudomonadota bacterium]
MLTAANWLTTHLNYQFSDPSLLERALTHRSAPGANNERLEFLGDAVLDSVVSDIVYHRHTEADEGDLSRLRASLVRDTTLAEIATELGLGQHLILGPGELKSGGYRNTSILADALEAIFGAVFLDGGFAAADTVIRHALEDRIQALPHVDDLKDPKTRLQEVLQADGLALPDYATESVSGKAHRQTFRVRCTVSDLKLETQGSGSSRRDAEQKAARRMLDAIRSHTES